MTSRLKEVTMEEIPNITSDIIENTVHVAHCKCKKDSDRK
jgi:2-iminoacetate synthase ThiH